MGQRDLEGHQVDIFKALHFHRSLYRMICFNHMLRCILLSFQAELSFPEKILLKKDFDGKTHFGKLVNLHLRRR